MTNDKLTQTDGVFGTLEITNVMHNGWNLQCHTTIIAMPNTN